MSQTARLAPRHFTATHLNDGPRIQCPIRPRYDCVLPQSFTDTNDVIKYCARPNKEFEANGASYCVSIITHDTSPKTEVLPAASQIVHIHHVA